MRFYKQPPRILLRRRSARKEPVHAHHSGGTVFARDLAANPQVFLDAVAPFRQGLVVGCECMFIERVVLG